MEPVHAVDPYAVAKARVIFTRAKGDPECAGPLAEWATERLAGDRDARRGVLVAADGAILGETRRGGQGPRAVTTFYVRSVVDERDADAVGRPADLAVGALRRATGQAVIHVTYSAVCMGPDPRKMAAW